MTKTCKDIEKIEWDENPLNFMFTDPGDSIEIGLLVYDRNLIRVEPSVAKVFGQASMQIKDLL